MQGYTYLSIRLFFLFFAPKHGLWVLVRTAGSNCVPTIYVLSKNKKKEIKNFLMKSSFFATEKILYLAWVNFRNKAKIKYICGSGSPTYPDFLPPTLNILLAF